MPHTDPIEQSPSSEANKSSASQEIPRLVWNPKVHYHIHSFPPLVPVLCQINPFYCLKYIYLKSHFDITLPSEPSPFKWSLSFRFSYHISAWVSPHLHTFYTTPSALLILLHLITRIPLFKNYKSWSFSPYNAVVMSSETFSSVPFYRTLAVCVLPLKLRDQISHPYKTGKNYWSSYFNFVLLGSKREDRIFWAEGKRIFAEFKPRFISSCMQFDSLVSFQNDVNVDTFLKIICYPSLCWGSVVHPVHDESKLAYH